MHARYRGQGNGYNRTNPIGMGGLATPSRISPEGSIRGPGFYNSEYRNFNRGGFGRGQRRHFQPPQPPARRGDVFVEAGKLAAEYLVSKGLLPPNALSGKWQNNSLKNQIRDFQSVRSQEGDGTSVSADARASAHSRLGNAAAADTGPGRRRHFDDYRRRPGSFKNYGYEWNRELGRSGSWLDRPRDTSDTDGDDNTTSVHKDDQKICKESHSGKKDSPQSETRIKSVNVGEVESTIEKNKSTDDGNATEYDIASNTQQSTSSRADVEPFNDSGDMKMLDVEGGEIKDESNINDMEQEVAKEEITVEPCADKDSHEPKHNSELLMLSRFANVPTKTRSSLAKIAKIDQDPTTEVKDLYVTEESRVHAQDVPVDSSSISELSNTIFNSKGLVSDLKEESARDEEQGFTYPNRQESCKNLVMFPRQSLMQEQQGNDGVHGFEKSRSMSVDRGEKRPIEDGNSWDGTKKPKEWVPAARTSSDGCLSISYPIGKQQISGEPMNFDRRADEKRLMDMSLFPKGDVAGIDFTEQKQLFPGSFKTCDLNLMEASEVIENHNNADPMIVFPPVAESGKHAMPVDIDLSINNNGNASEKFVKCGSDGKEIEVIDLENEFVQDKAFNNSERRGDSVFTGLENFPSNPHNSNEITDAQDGYGLMISELLGNDIPNCSDVPQDMNSLHNNMGLHNGEGILGDDDSIYMTLGEIPISFIRSWEQQPSQDYGKPF